MFSGWEELLIWLGIGKEGIPPRIPGRRYGKNARVQRLRRFLKRAERRERALQPARS